MLAASRSVHSNVNEEKVRHKQIQSAERREWEKPTTFAQTLVLLVLLTSQFWKRLELLKERFFLLSSSDNIVHLYKIGISRLCRRVPLIA